MSALYITKRAIQVRQINIVSCKIVTLSTVNVNRKKN